MGSGGSGRRRSRLRRRLFSVSRSAVFGLGGRYVVGGKLTDVDFVEFSIFGVNPMFGYIGNAAIREMTVGFREGL